MGQVKVQYRLILLILAENPATKNHNSKRSEKSQFLIKPYD